jgi:hypothetical protein
MMTVRELIEELQKHDEASMVIIEPYTDTLVRDSVPIRVRVGSRGQGRRCAVIKTAEYD